MIDQRRIILARPKRSKTAKTRLARVIWHGTASLTGSWLSSDLAVRIHELYEYERGVPAIVEYLSR